MNSWKEKIWNYGEKIRQLHPRYRILMGSQLFFVLAAFRFHRYSNNNLNSDLGHQQQQPKTTIIDPKGDNNV